jgi:transglutaminase-like putative cysteine protease
MPEFKIKHITRYTYESPVRDSANQVILYPIKDEYQDVLKHEIKITGDPSVDIHLDYYGNEVGSFTHTEPHTQLEIVSKILVNTRHRPYPVDDMFADQQWSDLLRLRYQVPYIDFLKQEYFEGAPELEKIIAAEKQPNETPYQAAMRYCKYIYENFKYIKGVTTVETTVDEIWKLRSGVCQDFAHMLMVMLRMMNIPARYVSGYICTQRSSMRGEGATHAWAEAYIPNFGWLGLDPTNNIIANENHVRLAVGRNFSDCSPVKGVYKGSARHVLDVSVTVGNDDDVHLDDHQDSEPVVPVFKPITQPARNSYRLHLEMMQQQQQQQQQ